VLEREETEERDLRHALAVRGRHREHAAFVVWLVVDARAVVDVSGHEIPSKTRVMRGAAGCSPGWNERPVRRSYASM
jgi:hypothetical protein